MNRTLCLAFLLLVAARTPQPGPVNPHIQSTLFSPDEVTLLRGALGWQIMIQFGDDERIENVSIGDAMAWQVAPNKKAHDLFLKPLLKNAATNMTVVTDKRTYSFELETGARSETTPWVLSFEYPREVVEAIEEPLPPPPPPLHFNYTVSGDPALRPARVWDDGTMTYFEFAGGQALPAIFAGGPKNHETLVNTSMRGRVIIVQQTSGMFTLRSGDQIATVVYGTGKAR